MLEKNPKSRTGGQFLIGAYAPYKQGLTRAIKYHLHQCEKYGVDTRHETEATPELIRSLAPDVLIMATGAKPFVPNIPGVKDTGVVLANDVLLGNPVLQSSCLIIGGGEVGVEMAEYATDYCDKVTIAEMQDDVAKTLYFTVRNALMKRLHEEDVEIPCNTKVASFIKGGIKALHDGKEITLDGYDTVILALGSKPYALLALMAFSALRIPNWSK